MGIEAIPGILPSSEDDNVIEPVEVSAAVFIEDYLPVQSNEFDEWEQHGGMGDLELNGPDLIYEPEHPDVPTSPYQVHYTQNDGWFPDLPNFPNFPINLINGPIQGNAIHGLFVTSVGSNYSNIAPNIQNAPMTNLSSDINEQLRLQCIYNIHVEELKYPGVNFDADPVIWTKKQRNVMKNQIRMMCIEWKRKEIFDTIAFLNDYHIVDAPGQTDNSKMAVEKIQELLSDMFLLDTKSLKELAVPLNEKIYDWEKVSDAIDRAHTPLDCVEFWHVKLHPDLNKSPWSKAENNMLSHLALAYDYHDWEEITREMHTGRSGYQCFVHYRRNIFDATPRAAMKIARRRYEAQKARLKKQKAASN